MSTPQVTCDKHGTNDLAIACIHVCLAIDSGEQVGFHWDTNTDGPRPDAWCHACELWRVGHLDAAAKDWMKAANFQFLCIRCWDEAKQSLYGQD